jgi:imidazolonepropionase-like amidohydrolase
LKLSELARALSLQVEAGGDNLDREVTGGYVGDLLSHVMAKAHKGDIWVTVQAHQNIVAVAVVANLSGIIVAEGIPIDPLTVQKAQDQGVPLFSVTASAYAVVAELVKAGVQVVG